MPVEVCGSILHDTCTRFGGFCVCACVGVCTHAQVLVDMRGVCISDPGHACNVGVSGVGGGMHAHVCVVGSVRIACISDPCHGCDTRVSGVSVSMCGVWVSVKAMCSWEHLRSSEMRGNGPGINGLLIDSSYIIFFPSRAYKSHAPCKNRI